MLMESVVCVCVVCLFVFSGFGDGVLRCGAVRGVKGLEIGMQRCDCHLRRC